MTHAVVELVGPCLDGRRIRVSWPCQPSTSRCELVAGHNIPKQQVELLIFDVSTMKGREKRHKRSSSRILNIINRTPAPIAVLVGIFLGLVIARLWFGPVRIFVSLVVAS